MARNIYGLDLGTYEIKVYDKNSNDFFKDKNVIAIQNKKNILAYGQEAFEMFEKAPVNIEVAFPMKEGVISRFNDMQNLLQNLVKQNKRFAKGSEYVIAVPTDVTEVEKKAFYDLVIHSTAKARNVQVVDRGIADAVGFGLDVKEEKGIFVANFGGETTELSVISRGGIVLNKLVKRGGVQFDIAIQNLVRHNYDFLIGRTTAETLRKKFGLFTDTGTDTYSVSGRNLITGIPQQKDIPLSLVRAAMKEPLEDCVLAIRQLLDRTPPDILTVIQKNGIYISGGVSNLIGLDSYLSQVLELPVHIASNPENNAIEGLAKIINSTTLSDLTYSMLDGNYRWMR